MHRLLNQPLPSASRGDGVYVRDTTGKRYLDFSGSAAVSFIGHSVPEISAAIARQAAELEFVHTSQFTTSLAEEYAQELLEFAGDNFRGGSIYFTCGGSESIETALKLARQYQVEVGRSRRYQVLSRDQSYHGSTLGAVAVSGNRRRREIYLPMIREFTHVGAPYCYRCKYSCEDCGRRYAEELEHAITAAEGQVAAFMLEPVSGATLGAAVPPDGYLKRVAEICRNQEILFIADEVMTGMGRTGRNFAVNRWNVQPDILVTAKGLSSGYAPLGAVLATKKVVDAIALGSGAFIHGFTYGAHPVSLAAGRAVLQHSKAQHLVEAADSDVPHTAAGTLKQALGKLRDLEMVGDVRGVGLLWGIEFVAERLSKRPFPPELNFTGRVAKAAAQRGLLVYPVQGCVDGIAGDHILLAPPAIISHEQIEWAVAELSSAIETASRQAVTSA